MRRLFWLGAGFSLGIAASRRASRHVANLPPGGLADRLHQRVLAAVDEGRREMRQREAALRTVLAAPGANDARK